MKTFIDLSQTVFSLPNIVNSLPKTVSFVKKNPMKIVDFGTVFVNWDSLQTEEQRQRVVDMSVSDAPVFTVPNEWRMPQLLKALGAFKSASAASKNGWNKDIPVGISEVVVRINKVRGSVWIHNVGPVDLI